MIVNLQKEYIYYSYDGFNSFGQAVLSPEPKGTIKISIFLNSQAATNTVDYNQAQYTGITHYPIDDSMVIDYDGIKLKVLTVNKSGRFNIAQMVKI